jgi:hypothetical protein
MIHLRLLAPRRLRGIPDGAGTGRGDGRGFLIRSFEVKR